MKLWFKRVFWLISLSIFLFMTVGCAGKTIKQPIGEEMSRKGTHIADGKGQKIKGYLLTDGTYNEFEGKVSFIFPDSLSFMSSDKSGVEVNEVGETTYINKHDMRMAIKDVSEITVVTDSSGGGAIAVFLFVGIIVAAIIAASSSQSSSRRTTSSSESCPFIFSHDGENYVFDGEPYGGATMASLQRTDASELEHLKAVDGEYRLRLTNEVDETQHTDQLEVIAVDHPVGTRAVMDFEGNPHVFGAQEGLSSAYDEDGRDLMVWLSEDDRSAWYPDLDTVADAVPLKDTRDHLTLEFPRPEGQDQVSLVTNVGTGLWGSHMIRVMLGMRGERVQEFYDAVNLSLDYQNQLRAWNEREELFVLGVEVQEGDQWVRRGEMHGGGPYMSERRAVPLDISGVQGDTVRLRVHPPIGFWRMNSFHLAWDEQPAEVSVAEVISATDQDGGDVIDLLAAIDDRTLDFPTNDDRADLAFRALPVRDGMDRTLFARTTGWYGIHLYHEKPPEAENLTRLTFEPGYVVHRAMEDYRDFRTTGKLSFTKPDSVLVQ